MIFSSFEQETAVTLFVFVVTLISATTWIVMVALELSSRDRDYWLVFYMMLGALMTVYFAVGYGLILYGREVRTADYFRTMISVLFFFFTGSGVFVYREREQSKVIAHQQQLIKELSRSAEEIVRDGTV